ncbi:MAG: TetR/AcrR family transcriptional regulator [Paeniclostridium sordellii]|uniref:TetR/AcrR family transcriptional regulator n=1 Tax=Paeniclostridium hominis TaxID=2764329 RepID=A0ABR7K4S3_9FIRM|nr:MULTISPECIES: TetR/AcrR family transcriptional regulator [Paeniclostridium]MBC6004107.1 TetR/AcrR family transcriptional regulator [Paeniclostridium hominis]MDU2591241.1 TetR/AcrR family transcriptional regulator [Paeniclostridium sordellii]
MTNKKEVIIQVAQKYFNDHGVRYTSIDDIVKECKISKSTFYKYFPTKEDLVLEILDYLDKNFSNSSVLIDTDDTKAPIEKLKEKIKLVLDYLKCNQSFNSHILGEFSEIKGIPILKIKSKIKSNIINSYKTPLILVYGEDINPFLWELIFVIDSIVHEFNLVMKINKRNISVDYIFEFINKQINLNIENLKQNKSTINKNIFYSIDEIGESNYKDSIKDAFLNVLYSIKECIKLDKNEKLSEAVVKIEEEFNLGNYNSLTMDAMIAYLEKQESIKEYTKKLNRLTSKLGDDIRSGE